MFTTLAPTFFLLGISFYNVSHSFTFRPKKSLSIYPFSTKHGEVVGWITMGKWLRNGENSRAIQFLNWHESNSVNRGKGARVFDPERIDGPDCLCFHGHSPNGERPWHPRKHLKGVILQELNRPGENGRFIDNLSMDGLAYFRGRKKHYNTLITEWNSLFIGMSHYVC